MNEQHEWAKRFHDEYERLAPEYGYETREKTRQFDPDSPNGRLMTAVMGSLGIARLNEHETLKTWLRVIFDSIDDYLAPVTAKGTTKDEYVPVEASTLAWWMDTIEEILGGNNRTNG